VGTQNLFDFNRDLFAQASSEDHLLAAFADVKRNHGAAGVDGVTIEMFSNNLHEEVAALAKELREWRYAPKPVRRVEIPKADGKGTRKLGIPTVRDRVVQTSLKQVLEPIFEPRFSQSSYGFRPGRDQKMAVKSACEIVQSGKEWVVDIDLAQFFDTLSQDRLIHRVGLLVDDKRILRLIGLTLRSGVQVGDHTEPTTQGSTQGSPLSPLLSNVVLDELDKELESRGLSFVRYADDANIFVRSEKAAQRVMASVTKFIEKRLRLVVNKEKSRVALSSAVKFLGFTIIAGTIAISAKSMARAMEKVRELTPTNSPVSVERTLEKVNSWYRGWAEYHAATHYPNQLLTLEAHIRRRLRARIARQCKRRRTLYRRLKQRGMKPKTAARVVYSNDGPWKISHSAMNHVYSVAWFEKIAGQLICSSRKLTHWFPVKRYIRLT
jgi:group II intron reverse transcriptase/maturase